MSSWLWPSQGPVWPEGRRAAMQLLLPQDEEKAQKIIKTKSQPNTSHAAQAPLFTSQSTAGYSSLIWAMPSCLHEGLVGSQHVRGGLGAGPWSVQYSRATIYLEMVDSG